MPSPSPSRSRRPSPSPLSLLRADAHGRRLAELRAMADSGSTAVTTASRSLRRGGSRQRSPSPLLLLATTACIALVEVQGGGSSRDVEVDASASTAATTASGDDSIALVDAGRGGGAKDVVSRGRWGSGPDWGWCSFRSWVEEAPPSLMKSTMRRSSRSTLMMRVAGIVVGVGVGVVPPERRPRRRPFFLLLPGRAGRRGRGGELETAAMHMPATARTTAKPRRGGGDDGLWRCARRRWRGQRRSRGGGGDDGEVSTDAKHHEGDDGDGCEDRGTGMVVTGALHTGGDVGGDRDNVDDAISASILDSDGDGITGHGDDGVFPSLASNARRGG